MHWREVCRRRRLGSGLGKHGELHWTKSDWQDRGRSHDDRGRSHDDRGRPHDDRERSHDDREMSHDKWNKLMRYAPSTQIDLFLKKLWMLIGRCTCVVTCVGNYRGVLPAADQPQDDQATCTHPLMSYCRSLHHVISTTASLSQSHLWSRQMFLKYLLHCLLIV